MAGNAIIGALRVVLGADTAALDKGLKSAQSSIDRFGVHVKNAGIIMAGALAGALAGVGVAVRSAINDADKLGKLAQSVGVPIEELSKLKHVAELAGVSLEGLSTGIVRLSRAMNEAASKSSGPAAEAFKALGISVRNADGSMKDASQIMSEVSDKFAGFKDGANKTALAVALFGRAGADLIPMLNQGSAAINAGKKEAEEFGLVVTKEAALGAEVFNDNMTRLSRLLSGVWVQVASRSSDTLARFSDTMVDAARNGGNLEAISNALNGMMKIFGSTVLIASHAMAQFNTYFGALIAAAQKLSSLDLSGALDDLKTGAIDVARNFSDLKKGMADLWAPPDQNGLAGAAREFVGVQKEILALGGLIIDQQKKDAPTFRTDTATKDATNAVENYISSIEKRKATLTAELQTIGMSTAAQESMRIKLEALTIAKEKNITVTEAMRARIDDAAASFGQMAKRVEDARARWDFVQGSLSTVADGLTDIAMRTKSAGEAFKEMALAIIRDFTNMIIKAQLFKAVTAFMGGFGGGNTYDLAFPTPIGARANGGPVMSGMPYLVGERGPEIIVPQSRGQVIPNNQLGGASSGGLTYAPVIDARGADAAAVERIERGQQKIAAELDARVRSIVQTRGSKRW